MQGKQQIMIPSGAVRQPAKVPKSPKMKQPVMQPTQMVVQTLLPQVSPLMLRMQNLQYGEVLDVSNIKANGTGVVKTTIPKTGTGAKIGTPNIPIISNNIEAYILALRMIYGANADRQFAADINAINNVFMQRQQLSALTQQVGLPQSPKSPRKRAVPSSHALADRVRDIKPGHVIDVSEMDAEGRNAHTIPTPKTTTKGKFGTDNVPIVSDNTDNYILALRMIYGADADRTFALDIRAVDNAIADHQYFYVTGGR
jgi:hypothetical protein